MTRLSRGPRKLLRLDWLTALGALLLLLLLHCFLAPFAVGLCGFSTELWVVVLAWGDCDARRSGAVEAV